MMDRQMDRLMDWCPLSPTAAEPLPDSGFASKGLPKQQCILPTHVSIKLLVLVLESRNQAGGTCFIFSTHFWIFMFPHLPWEDSRGASRDGNGLSRTHFLGTGTARRC